MKRETNKKNKINVKVIIPIIIISIIAAALIIFISNEEPTKNKVDDQWIKSGSFEIDKPQYYIGEKIFLSTTNLLPEDKGIVQFLRPIDNADHKSYIRIPFNGMDKTQFNYYFEPRFNQNAGICEIEDVAGNWIVKFIGTEYEDLNFEILNRGAPWDDRTFEPIC